MRYLTAGCRELTTTSRLLPASRRLIDTFDHVPTVIATYYDVRETNTSHTLYMFYMIHWEQSKWDVYFPHTSLEPVEFTISFTRHETSAQIRQANGYVRVVSTVKGCRNLRDIGVQINAVHKIPTSAYIITYLLTYVT